METGTLTCLEHMNLRVNSDFKKKADSVRPSKARSYLQCERGTVKEIKYELCVKPLLE